MAAEVSAVEVPAAALLEVAPDPSPEPEAAPRREGDALILTILLKSTGDSKRDALRMRRVHGLLTSYHGNDRFVFHVFEASRQYHLEFPNSTTGHGPELMAQLRRLLGEGMVRVEPLRLQ
jgi:hypothetical protein